ncbi:hypothetical protein [Sulfurovum sp.]|uniref:hypothetical protein n=1 Tax=Sulfurovum sp. TaxID=1969726 RepID=UPI00356AC361
MDNFGDRLLYFIQTLHVSQSKFANNIDVNAQMVNRYCNNAVFPGNDFFRKLKKSYPLINLDWLLTGQNNMYLQDNLPVGINKLTLEIFEKTYKEFEENKNIDELNTLLLNASLEMSIASIYKDLHTANVFWSSIVNHRQQIVSLLLLQRVLKVAIKNKNFLSISKENAKKQLIDIFKSYSLALSDRAVHFITINEKEKIIENLEKNLSDEAALTILDNIPDALEKISTHLKYRRSFKN